MKAQLHYLCLDLFYGYLYVVVAGSNLCTVLSHTVC